MQYIFIQYSTAVCYRGRIKSYLTYKLHTGSHICIYEYIALCFGWQCKFVSEIVTYAYHVLGCLSSAT